MIEFVSSCGKAALSDVMYRRHDAVDSLYNSAPPSDKVLRRLILSFF